MTDDPLANPLSPGITRADACRTIEALRAGVAAPCVSRYLSRGRDEILRAVAEDLLSVQADGKSRGLVISASYGQGKSHLLNLVSTTARDNGFAVAKLVLSKEAPVHNLKRLYQKIATSVILPSEDEPGMERALGALRPTSNRVQDLFFYSSTKLHPRINAPLVAYFNTSDAYEQSLLFGDLVGDFLPLYQLRAITKAANAGEKVPKLPREEFGQYFLLLAALVRTLGWRGLVLLLDEVELLAALSISSRVKAYLHIASLLGVGGPFTARHMYTVLFVASGFYADVISGRGELQKVRSWATERYGEEVARQVGAVLDVFISDRIELPDLSEQDVRTLLLSITKLHGQAYKWNASLDMDQVLDRTKNSPLRTVLRGAVEWLDLAYLYAEKPAFAVKEVNGGIPLEDEDLFAVEAEPTNSPEDE